MHYCYRFFYIIFFLLISVLAAAQERNPEALSVSHTGKIVKLFDINDTIRNSSQDGRYTCTYDIGRVSDEIRELKNLKFFEEGKLIFTMDEAPGSDLYISNSGYIAFMDMKRHFLNEVEVHFYDRQGQYLSSRTFNDAFLFGFSSKGNKFGVGTPEQLNIISLKDNTIDILDKGFQFDISENEEFTAVAGENRVKIYRHGTPVLDLETDMQHHRSVKISTLNDAVAVAGRKQVKIYSLADGNLRFEDTLTGRENFRDLEFDGNELAAGIQYRDRTHLKGSLKKYDLSGYNNTIYREGPSKKLKSFPGKQNLPKKNTVYPKIPWPFEPFDELHTVWDYYEQHMGSTYPYLHQGLDLIVPVGEPAYAVQEGIVKCVLTIGGASYWRLATAETQVSGESEGWLYAHLIESSIAVDVGDTVEVHDYLGDIIMWIEEWGHIHFARIKDSGTVWRYDDGEWGIVYNPLLALEPNTDTIAPVIKDVKAGKRFMFFENGQDTEVDADSLYRDIDIVVKVEDYIGDAEWTIPAYRTYYSVERLSDNSEVFPRTLAHVLNHEYGFYASTHYYDYAPLIYKANRDLRAPYWMEIYRNYYHILTNSDGDSLISLSERNLAFPTADYPDGDYRIIVEAYDAYGNSDTDSMNVTFKNGVTTDVDDRKNFMPDEFLLKQNYPNPFNTGTVIEFTLPSAAEVTLKIYDLLGREVKMLAYDHYQRGTHRLKWDGTNDTGTLVSSGVYLYRLKSGQYDQLRKMVLIK
ncbi:FlgD immunoglobulin-like domain containing protein [candidate division KSB1 bacterium]